ncbi:MAG: 30S ribosomal protein S6 [Kiritimatiellaeota bacterium]|nr:30S ribosomal protein S6 [Kiritimatiellota bacterium]
MLKKYDAMFIFSGSTKDEALEKAIEKVTAEITRLGGTIDDTDTIGRRTFSRQIQKRDSGIYVKVRFQIDPTHLPELRGRYRLSEDVVRMQLLARDERYDTELAKDKERRVAFRIKAEAEAARAAAESEAAIAAAAIPSDH